MIFYDANKLANIMVLDQLKSTRSSLVQDKPGLHMGYHFCVTVNLQKKKINKKKQQKKNQYQLIYSLFYLI